MTTEDEQQFIQTKNLVIDILNTINKYPDLTDSFNFHLNNMLDNMADNDTFGTEAQLDPRNDKRG